MMRGHGYKLLVIDYENNKILEIHSIAADYKPQQLIPLIMQLYDEKTFRDRGSGIDVDYSSISK